MHTVAGVVLPLSLLISLLVGRIVATACGHPMDGVEGELPELPPPGEADGAFLRHLLNDPYAQSRSSSAREALDRLLADVGCAFEGHVRRSDDGHPAIDSLLLVYNELAALIFDLQVECILAPQFFGDCSHDIFFVLLRLQDVVADAPQTGRRNFLLMMMSLLEDLVVRRWPTEELQELTRAAFSPPDSDNVPGQQQQLALLAQRASEMLAAFMTRHSQTTPEQRAAQDHIALLHRIKQDLLELSAATGSTQQALNVGRWLWKITTVLTSRIFEFDLVDFSRLVLDSVLEVSGQGLPLGIKKALRNRHAYGSVKYDDLDFDSQIAPIHTFSDLAIDWPNYGWTHLDGLINDLHQALGKSFVRHVANARQVLIAQAGMRDFLPGFLSRKTIGAAHFCFGLLTPRGRLLGRARDECLKQNSSRCSELPALFETYQKAVDDLKEAYDRALKWADHRGVHLIPFNYTSFDHAPSPTTKSARNRQSAVQS